MFKTIDFRALTAGRKRDHPCDRDGGVNFLRSIEARRSCVTIPSRMGKGSKERRLPIGRNAVAWIENWLDLRDLFGSEDDALFLSAQT